MGEGGGGVACGVDAVSAAGGLEPAEEGVNHEEKKDGGEGASLEGTAGDWDGGCGSGRDDK